MKLSNQVEKILIPTGIIWECKQVATQPVGAPATMGYVLTIPEGERGLLMGGRMGADNYGAGRTIVVTLDRPAGSALYRIASAALDNWTLAISPTLTSITVTAQTQNVIGIPYMPYVLPELTEITINGLSLANAETVTGNIFIATRAFPPQATIVGTGVTLTTNTILQV